MLRAVLFDLDDTLFDHRTCARTALTVLHGAYPELQACDFAEIERLHAGYLDVLHRRVLARELGIDEAREERFRRLFAAVGASLDDEGIARAAAVYREGYLRIWQALPGAVPLLAAVKAHARVGIVSNNLLEEQQTKLRQCGLEPYVDVLVVSEEAGMSKPDPAIFERALERLDCRADEAVMVGDSWSADVVGARAIGVTPIWFNPDGHAPPEPDAQVTELRALEPPEEALSVILSAATVDERGLRP